jgi:multidrug resistance efflux pump
MVTIIPVEMDDDFVQRGVQMAAAEEIQRVLKNLNELARDLSSGGVIARAEFERAWDAITESKAKLWPALEYARAFQDQWPGEEEGDGQQEAH